MILNITDELIDTRNSLNNFYQFFRNMMLAYSESKHIICISPKKVKELLEEEEILKNREITQILNHYKNHAKEQNIINLKLYFNVIINIVSSNEKKENLENIEYRNIHYLKFLDTASIQKTILLGENASDVDVYNIFVEYYRNKNNLKGYFTSYSKKGGGGSTIHQEYKSIYENNTDFCLCLLDSDKKYMAQTTFGDTADKVVKYHESQNNINYKIYYYILDVLELENCLPIGFYLDKYYLKTNIYEIIEKIAKEDIDFRRYFDFKSGIVCKLKFDKENKISDCDAMHLKDYLCPLVQKYNPCTIKDGKTVIIEGFSKNILDDFIKYSFPEKIFKFVDEDSFVINYWMGIGKYIASHTLVPQVPRAI